MSNNINVHTNNIYGKSILTLFVLILAVNPFRKYFKLKEGTNEEIIDGKKDRILAEWKENIALHKWHDDLKQKRFNYFITIQAALLALTGSSLRDINDKQRDSVITLIGITIFIIVGILSASLFKKLDERASAYVRHVKNAIRYNEHEWELVEPKNMLTTYERQFQVLGKGTASLSASTPPIFSINEFVIKQETAASLEISAIKTARWLWLAMIFATLTSFSIKNYGHKVLSINNITHLLSLNMF